MPPRSKGDYAFITHMIETITEDSGRVGVVVPHGVLFRGASEGVIRRKLIEANLLDTVVGLPANLFYGTGIPAAILVFKKHKRNKTVLFIDAGREYEDGTNQNRLRTEDIDKIVAAYKARKNVEMYAHVADLTDLAPYSAGFQGRTYFLSCSKQTTNPASINSTQLKEMPLALPPLPEQLKIAAILSTWDRAIALTEKLIAAKQQRKAASAVIGNKAAIHFHSLVFSEARCRSLRP